jgi:hypothetical protein
LADAMSVSEEDLVKQLASAKSSSGQTPAQDPYFMSKSQFLNYAAGKQ